jgi:hypothetical protein
MDIPPARLAGCFAEERGPILHNLQRGIKPPLYLVAFIAPFHVIQINSKILVERFVCFIMAEGIVGLVFGVSGVFTLVDQCLTLYRHIDEAQTFGENVWQQYVLFQHECARFNSWQKEMRDFHLVTRPSLPSSSLSTGLETPNADDLMHNTLAQIISILEAVQSLCKEYRVNELDHSRYTKLKKAGVADLSAGLATTVIGSAIASDGKLAISAQTKRQNEAFFKKNTGLFKRIRYSTKLWKESDKETLQKLVTQFAHWNDCLQRFLPTARRMLLDLVSSSTLLEGEGEVSDLGRIQVAASTGLYESLARRVALKQANLEFLPGPSLKKGLECLGNIDIGSIMSLPRAIIAVFGLDKGGRKFVNLSIAPLHIGTFSFL